VATMKENLRFATDFMARDIRGAGLREDGELDLPGALEPAEPGSIEQQQFAVRKAGMNCLGETGPWVASIYSVHDNQLRCGNDAVPPQNQPLVSGVRSMTAVALDAWGRPDWDRPVALRIELELESRAGSQVLTHAVQFVVSLRNAVLERYQWL
jgi:type IV pilus assembly protein PilW